MCVRARTPILLRGVPLRARACARVCGHVAPAPVEYKDASMPEEIRLIRQLMRTEDPAARKQQLVRDPAPSPLKTFPTALCAFNPVVPRR